MLCLFININCKMSYKFNESERNSRLLIVPWYDKQEWLKTYQEAYSDDVVLQNNSYTQMGIWKARCPELPLGVECTMSILHVRLCDKQVESDETTPAFKDRDLQLLYSTAVMRFLNHLSVISNCKDSMYKMAKQQNVPDWLINLRHEAAHGNSLPALYLLRQASDIIMQWLRDNYWEAESEAMEDFIVNQKTSTEDESVKIKKLLDMWLTLKLNYWSGRKTIDNIINEDVRTKVMELTAQEGLGIKRSADSQMNTDCKKMKTEYQSSDGDKLETDTIINPQEQYINKIKTIFNPLLRKLFDPLKEKKHKKIWYQDCLIECLVNYTGFCPQIDLEKLTEKETLELMSLQGELWKEVLEELQANSLLSLLISALMAKQDEVCVHLWLRLLAHLLSGDMPHQPRGTLPLCQRLANCLPCEVNPQALKMKANSLHARRQHSVHLKPSAKELDVLQRLAHKVLSNPTKLTSKYLKSLLAFWETPLRAETKENLCTLAQIYSGCIVSKCPPVKVYTLSSLMDHGCVINQSKLSMSDDSDDDSSPWKLYSGDANWSKCALGTLPANIDVSQFPLSQVSKVV